MNVYAILFYTLLLGGPILIYLCGSAIDGTHFRATFAKFVIMYCMFVLVAIGIPDMFGHSSYYLTAASVVAGGTLSFEMVASIMKQFFSRSHK